jgi:hypothetical protein
MASARTNALTQDSKDRIPPPLARSAFFFFLDEGLNEGPMDPTTISRESTMRAWEALSDEAKEPYIAKEREDTVRYSRESEAYVRAGTY